MSNMQNEIDRVVIAGGDIKIPMPPKFDNAADERRHRLERLAASFRLFAHFGFDEGVAGHITVRDPEFPDRFWVNPIAKHFSLMKVSDLIQMSHDGKILQGNQPVNTAAFAIHSRVHAARPDVEAVAHAHSPHGRAWSALGRPLDPISQDACVFYEDHAVHDAFSGVVEDLSEGDSIAKAMGNKKGVILQNHGHLTVGKTVDAATWLFILMDSLCRGQLMAEAAGEIKKVPHEIALKTREYNGTDFVNWGNFQPLYEMIHARDPSFLD